MWINGYSPVQLSESNPVGDQDDGTLPPTGLWFLRNIARCVFSTAENDFHQINKILAVVGMFDKL